MKTFQIKTKSGAVFNVVGEALSVEPVGVIGVCDAAAKFIAVVAVECVESVRQI